MASLKVEIINLEAETFYGLWKESNDKTISKDIYFLSEEYYNTICSSKGTVLPYIVLSRNYDEKSRNFEMFIGSYREHPGLKCLTMSAGRYAKITIKPKFGFLWGTSIGEAKQYFYTKYLSSSSYEGLNMEYEFHTEKSKVKHPTIDIIFAIKEKN